MPGSRLGAGGKDQGQESRRDPESVSPVALAQPSGGVNTWPLRNPSSTALLGRSL